MQKIKKYLMKKYNLIEDFKGSIRPGTIVDVETNGILVKIANEIPKEEQGLGIINIDGNPILYPLIPDCNNCIHKVHYRFSLRDRYEESGHCSLGLLPTNNCLGFRLGHYP